MKLKVFTFQFSESRGGFDDEPLQAFIVDKEVIEYTDHFFIHEKTPHLTVILSYRDISPDEKRRLERRQDPRKELDEKEKTAICKKRNALLVSTKELLEKCGFVVPVVSAGGSNTYRISGCCPGITDIQPGSYVTMDDWNAKHGLDFEQAITVLSTVVSRPEKSRAIIDAGLKAISTDHGLPRIISHKGLQIEVLNEEHGKLTFTDAGTDIDIGDKVELVPSHGCTTMPLYDRYIAMKDGQPIASMSMVSGSASY